MIKFHNPNNEYYYYLSPYLVYFAIVLTHGMFHSSAKTVTHSSRCFPRSLHCIYVKRSDIPLSSSSLHSSSLA